jgi:hypothetical protein
MRQRRLIRIGLFAAFAAGGTLPAFGQESPANLLAAGGFEFEGISLRLPEVSPFPLVVGGWGSRADDSTAAVAVTRDGRQALEITNDARRAAYVIQDAPLATAGFVFRAAVQRRSGRQFITLHGAWDRMDPEAAALVRLDLRAAVLRVTTADGSWVVPGQLNDGAWHELELVSDPRTNQVTLRVNGTLRGTFPGATNRVPRTVILGGHRGAAVSAFRYDDLVLERLPELELAALQQVLAEGDAPAAVQRRIDAARQAMFAGSPRMMAAELRAAGRLLEAVAPAATLDQLGRLLELVSARQQAS